MDTGQSRAKGIAILLARVLLIGLGWCLVMVIYATTYQQLQFNASPVTMTPFLDFQTESWDQGYFHAKGSLQNDNARDDGEELVLLTVDVSCQKDHNQCTVATADYFDSAVNLDVTPYDIERWDDNEITWSDSSSICANNTYVINRKAQTFTISVRKKDPIPDYARKSSLHPCDHMSEGNQSLVSGAKTNEQKRRAFDRANGFYLHLYLVALNLAYIGFIYWMLRRRQARRQQTCNV